MSTLYLNRLLQLKNRSKRSLESIQVLQKLLDYPDRKFKSVHVAGTNGKGSVCTKMAKACELAGYKTALYTSPHIKDFYERIQMDGNVIPQETLEVILKHIFDLAETHQLELSFFDVATMAAFVYFAENEVDIAIIETGLGGRWDATNIIQPILAVITTLGFDHTEILGSKIEEIAHEKAGIIKQRIPVVIGPRVPHSLISSYSDHITQPTGLFTHYDEENRATAEAALKLLDIPLKGTDVRPRCRLEKIGSNNKSIYLDAGHNPDALEALFKSLKATTNIHKPDVLCAFSKEKDIASCMKIIATHARHIYVTKADTPRAADPQELAVILKDLNFNNFSIFNETESALNSAAANDHSLLVCGTFYILDDACRFFSKKE